MIQFQCAGKVRCSTVREQRRNTKTKKQQRINLRPCDKQTILSPESASWAVKPGAKLITISDSVTAQTVGRCDRFYSPCSFNVSSTIEQNPFSVAVFLSRLELWDNFCFSLWSISSCIPTAAHILWAMLWPQNTLIHLQDVRLNPCSILPLQFVKHHQNLLISYLVKYRWSFLITAEK